MPDETEVQITDLADATTPTGNEYAVISQTGLMRKLALSDFPRQTAVKPITATYSGNTAYMIPAGMLLMYVVILPQAADETIKIGRTAGANDLFLDELVQNGKYIAPQLGVYSPEGAPVTIYISGITDTTKVIFYIS